MAAGLPLPERLAERTDCAYNLTARITFDPRKNERNIRERGLPFGLAAEFEFETAHIQTDLREEYPETRYVASVTFTDGCTSCALPKRLMAFASSASEKQMIER